MASRVVDYAVFMAVTSGRWLKVENHSQLIPPDAISCIGDRHIAVRKQDFDIGTMSADQSLKESSYLRYDLHDFSHLITACLCPRLYGNKYLLHLAKLPLDWRKLISSPGEKKRHRAQDV